MSKLSRDIAIPSTVRFWIILPFYIPSVICSLFVLYHFIFNRNLRNALHNHVITFLLIINLIVQLTTIPWILSFYYLQEVLLKTSIFCLTWVFIDEALYITTTIIFAWATIERHILIFHDRLLLTKKRLIFFHYFPIVLLVFYCICYNTIVVIVPPCENVFDYTQLVCGYPLCYYANRLVAVWDSIVNDLIPTIIIICCSIALLLRTLYQKYRMNRPIRWRNHRKMTIQLLSISFMYLILYMPKILMRFIYLCGVSEEFGADYMLYAKFFAYYGNILLPFVCAGSMPELQTKIKKLFPCWRRKMRTVGPQPLLIPHRPGGQNMKLAVPV